MSFQGSDEPVTSARLLVLPFLEDVFQLLTSYSFLCRVELGFMLKNFINCPFELYEFCRNPSNCFRFSVLLLCNKKYSLSGLRYCHQHKDFPIPWYLRTLDADIHSFHNASCIVSRKAPTFCPKNREARGLILAPLKIVLKNSFILSYYTFLPTYGWEC